MPSNNKKLRKDPPSKRTHKQIMSTINDLSSKGMSYNDIIANIDHLLLRKDYEQEAEAATLNQRLQEASNFETYEGPLGQPWYNQEGIVPGQVNTPNSEADGIRFFSKGGDLNSGISYKETPRSSLAVAASKIFNLSLPTSTEKTTLSFPKDKKGIKAVQQILKDQGLYAGKIDGLVGPKSKKALEMYNSPVPGKDKETVSSSKEETEALQSKLKDLGFYKGKIDGIVGPKTKKAMDLYNSLAGKGGEPLMVLNDYGMLEECAYGECAEYQNILSSEIFGTDSSTYKETTGSTGNAWQRKHYMNEVGGKDIPLDDFKSMKIGDTVFLDRERFGEKDEAKDQAQSDPYSTGNPHVGVIVGMTPDSIPLVAHNFHKQVLIEPINDIKKKWKYEPIAVTRPEINSPIEAKAKKFMRRNTDTSTYAKRDSYMPAGALKDGGYLPQYNFGGLLQSLAPAAGLIPGVGAPVSAGLGMLGGLFQGNPQPQLPAQANANPYGRALGGDLDPVSSNTVEVDGHNPNQVDGVDIGSAYVDHGETITDDYVFSDILTNPVTGNTFAKDNKKIAKSDAAAEKKTNDREARNTLKYNDMKRNKLQQANEVMRMIKESTKGLKYGGYVKKDSYKYGGNNRNVMSPFDMNLYSNNRIELVPEVLDSLLKRYTDENATKFDSKEDKIGGMSKKEWEKRTKNMSKAEKMEYLNKVDPIKENNWFLKLGRDVERDPLKYFQNALASSIPIKAFLPETFIYPLAKGLPSGQKGLETGRAVMKGRSSANVINNNSMLNAGRKTLPAGKAYGGKLKYANGGEPPFINPYSERPIDWANAIATGTINPRNPLIFNSDQAGTPNPQTNPQPPAAPQATGTGGSGGGKKTQPSNNGYGQTPDFKSNEEALAAGYVWDTVTQQYLPMGGQSMSDPIMALLPEYSGNFNDYRRPANVPNKLNTYRENLNMADDMQQVQKDIAERNMRIAAGIDPDPSATQSDNGNDKAGPLGDKGFNWAEGLQYGELGAKALMMLRGRDKQELYQNNMPINTRQYNVQPVLNQNQRTFNAAKQSIANAPAYAGLSNLQQAYANKYAADTRAQAQYEDMNVQAANRADQLRMLQKDRNIQRQYATDQIRQQDEAAYFNRIDDLLTSVGNIGRGKVKQKENRKAVELILSAYPDIAKYFESKIG